MVRIPARVAPKISGYSLLTGLSRQKITLEEPSSSSYAQIPSGETTCSTPQHRLIWTCLNSPRERSTCVFGALKQGTGPLLVSSCLEIGRSRRQRGLDNTVGAAAAAAAAAALALTIDKVSQPLQLLCEHWTGLVMMPKKVTESRV